MKKGFTLIELLAVIVILAIIALIATPIILGIINNAKEESDKRSVELYVKAAELAVARKNLEGEFKPTTCTVEGGVCMCEGYTDPLNVEMDNASNISGTITFNEKGIVTDNTLVVGKGGTTPVGEQYLYQWYIGRTVPGPTIGNSINFADYPEENGFLYSTTPPSEKIYYNKFKVEDNVVTEGYSCAIFNETEERCLEGGSKDTYGWVTSKNDSTGRVAKLYAIEREEISGVSCSFSSSYSYCSDGSVVLAALSSDRVHATSGGDIYCLVLSDGSSRCLSYW